MVPLIIANFYVWEENRKQMIPFLLTPSLEALTTDVVRLVLIHPISFRTSFIYAIAGFDVLF